METLALYQDAMDDNIPVIFLNIPESGSMCIQLDDGQCFIGMDLDLLFDNSRRRVHLAHELGHCKTGSFYNRWSAQDVRQKYENRADKWAIEKLIPENELNAVVARGYTEPWELAEYFGVTETFVKKAVCWYQHRNLAAEQYV